MNDEEKRIFKGFRTIIVGLALAIAPTALTYLTGVDWASYLGPTGAFFVSGVLMIAMRYFTNTKVGSKV